MAPGEDKRTLRRNHKKGALMSSGVAATDGWAFSGVVSGLRQLQGRGLLFENLRVGLEMGPIWRFHMAQHFWIDIDASRAST